MNILAAVADLGLGHASRSVPLLAALARRHRLVVSTRGPAEAYLRRALADQPGVLFRPALAYPRLMRGQGPVRYVLGLLQDALAFHRILPQERRLTEALVTTERLDLVLSDGRYGAYSSRVPAFIISHQARLVLPGPGRLLTPLLTRLNLGRLARFQAVIVPDAPGSPLSGRLSRPGPDLARLPRLYAGPLSALALAGDPAPGLPLDPGEPRFQELLAGLDLLVVLGGYLDEHKAPLLEKMTTQVRELGLRAIIVAGEFGRGRPEWLRPNLLRLPWAWGPGLRLLFERAGAILGRTGYSTLMDLAEVRRPAYLIPTPGMVEQAYLAERLARRGWAATAGQAGLDLGRWLAQRPAGLLPELPGTTENVARLADWLEERKDRARPG